MSAEIIVAMIGAVAVVLGAAVPLWRRSGAAKIESRLHPAASESPAMLWGEIIDIREQRILRALFAEPNGR
jgi:hypothetical protein